MRDSATGFIIEPPIPCTSRAAISSSMLDDKLQSREPIAKVA
jgi:hypothetical protein